MAIRIVDVATPLGVAAADILTEKFAPTWAEPVTYLMAFGGYAANYFGYGGDISKNVGIAALPLAAKKLYNRFLLPVVGRSLATVARGAGGGVQRVSRSYKPEFEDVVQY